MTYETAANDKAKAEIIWRFKLPMPTASHIITANLLRKE
jgi:hypothetical protein